MNLEIIILAAGKGKRMHSSLPKVLHKVADKPMLQHVIDTACLLSPKAIHIVVGHQSDRVLEMINTLPLAQRELIHIAIQKEQLGTGHAVACAMPNVDKDSCVLVLYGDTPLTPASLLSKFYASLSDHDLLIMSAYTDNPFGYGRIIRGDDNKLVKITEEKDANNQEKQIKEVNTGIILAKSSTLDAYLPRIKNSNTQGEYYLTDLPELLINEHQKVGVMIAPDFEMLLGVNSKTQLSVVERLYQRRKAQELLELGVTLADPERFDLRGQLECGQDVFIDINCIFSGTVKLGNNVIIGPGCLLKDCEIGDNSVISAYTVIEESLVKKANTLGPFARLRPGNILEDNVHVGNFVECKKAHLGQDTKAGHLSYLGDAEIGKNVNIGAGTITCNYDGANKFKTTIGDDVFIGSDTQLVAPVTVKNGVTVGAGTTVTKRISSNEGALIITRAEATVIDNYPRPHKQH